MKRENKSILRKSKHGIIRIVFSRAGLLTCFVLLQFAFLFIGIYTFSDKTEYFWLVSSLFSLIILMVIFNSTSDPTSKLTWTVMVLLFPFFGAPLYFFTKSNLGNIRLNNKYRSMINQTRDLIQQDQELTSHLEKNAAPVAAVQKYLSRSGCHPVYNNTKVSYFPLGEEMWTALLSELKNAKEFIFLEYFIIEKGVMWESILEILTQKVQNGVEVRILYGGTCEFTSLPHNYPKKLAKLGIQCKIFSPITPFISTHYNYRDHRKIAVIDGKVGFTGGINLADEYINRNQRFGHWKDAGIALYGEAVKTLTLLFLQMWNLDCKDQSITPYINQVTAVPSFDGYVIPFGDSPLDDYRSGEMIYMDILNRAERYVYIMTPYLILDGELEAAIKFAAERGVEVAIMIPAKPDKKIPYALARTHFRSLLRSGVKIYEYTPGFIHSKLCVSDDKVGMVGTINLDYRSFYHHFETAVYMYQTECLQTMKADFIKNCQISKEIELPMLNRKKIGYAIVGAILKIIAPLL